MPDQLTASERAAIEAFKGPVIRGRSGERSNAVVAKPRTPGSHSRQPLDMSALRAEYEPLVKTMTRKQIAAHRHCTVVTVDKHLKKLGIKAKPASLGPKPKKPGRRRIRANDAEQKRAARADRSVSKVTDRRRFKTVPVPMGDPAFSLPEDHESVVNAMPRFPSRVFDPADPDTYSDTILKDGCHNSKIGGDVSVGNMKGAHIVTLTLAERATCPRSCAFWNTCYGNADPHAKRWLPGQALLDRLDAELADLCARHPAVLVRLHYLGDFYDAGYVEHWAQLLTDFDNLHAFGFTAHRPGTPMGDLINAWRCEFGFRFAIRHSDTTGAWGSFTVDFPTEKTRIGDAVVCPEQRDAMTGGKKLKHCGSCALCWQSDSAIVFVEH